MTRKFQICLASLEPGIVVIAPANRLVSCQHPDQSPESTCAPVPPMYVLHGAMALTMTNLYSKLHGMLVGSLKSPLHVSRRIESFCWRVEQLVGEGGYALVTDAPGTGKSVTLAGRQSR